jgi:DNA-binding IclR family transcriptional regulator
MQDISKSRRVKSVDTAFQIIWAIQSLDGASLTELSDNLQLANSTVHNYLTTLQSMGYVIKTDSGKYRLGLRFLTHGVAAKKSLNIQTVVMDTLSTISNQISYPVWWVCEEHGRANFLEKAVPESEKQIYGRIGKRSYLHTHSLGKAILADMPRSEVESIIDFHGLPEQTPNTVTDPDQLFRELDTIREQDYAISKSETVLRVQSIGVSFQSPSGRRNAIGVFGYARDLLGQHTESNIASTLVDEVSDLREQLYEEDY